MALIPHASKVLLHVIHDRLKNFLLPEIAEEQSGFIPRKGAREQILNVRQIIEKAREFNVTTFLCFVDYTKAFYSVKWAPLWNIRIEMGVPRHLVKLVRSLYENNTATVRVKQRTSGILQAQAGTRQGCILSHILFNIYLERIMRKVLENWEGVISVGGKKIGNLKYAEEILILSTSAKETETFMTMLMTTSREYGLNGEKTKVMIVDRLADNQLNVREVAGFEVVKRFSYLDSFISNSGGQIKGIKRNK